MKYKINFDCEHCGSPKIANSKEELIDIIVTELKKPNFVGFKCTRGTGLHGCKHWFEEKVIIITPIEHV